MADAAVAAGLPDRAVFHYPDAAAAGAAVPERLRSGDLVLVKASRGIRLETVADAIAAARGAANMQQAG
jgi:UDP-N-acetylmuramoyl-tripeptide--D-alanyl-D-alanine ligase